MDDIDIQDVPLGDEGGGGESAGSWLDGMPEDLRESPQLSKFKSPEDVARSYINLETMVGRKRAIPAEDAPQEEWDKYYADIGRPESPESYSITRPEDWPEEYGYNQELENNFRRSIHQAGLTNKQAKIIYDNWMNATRAEADKMMQSVSQARETAEKTLQAEWGDAYSEKLAAARQAMRQFAPAGSAAWQEFEKGIGNNIEMVKFMANVGAQVSEGELVKGSANVKTADEERNELMKHPAYMDPAHPEHDDVVRKVAKAWGIEIQA